MRTVGHRCEPCVATAAFIKTLIRLQQQERRRRQQQEAAVAAAAAAVTFGASMAAGPDNYGAVGESHTDRLVVPVKCDVERVQKDLPCRIAFSSAAIQHTVIILLWQTY